MIPYFCTAGYNFFTFLNLSDSKSWDLVYKFTSKEKVPDKSLDIFYNLKAVLFLYSMII